MHRRLALLPLMVFALLLSESRAAGQTVDSIKFEDASEHAFTTDVPRGWTVRGGLFRFGYSDERPMIDMTSPDGRINVRLGDVSLPTYFVPNQNHQREGETYDLGAQAQLVVASYHPGPEFAILYSQARFNRLCSNPVADAADVHFSVPDYVPADANPTQTSTGQIAYRCDTQQGPRIAFAFVRTSLFAGFWQATVVGSFLVPPDQIGLARSVLLQSARAFKLEPQWIESQKQMDAMAVQYQRARQAQRVQQLGQQVQQFEAQMRAQQQQVNAFERRQNAQAAQVEGFLNVLNGVTPTVDPLTGQEREVWTGTKSRYWANGQGDVVNSDDPPSSSYHQLQVPPQH